MTTPAERLAGFARLQRIVDAMLQEGFATLARQHPGTTMDFAHIPDAHATVVVLFDPRQRSHGELILACREAMSALHGRPPDSSKDRTPAAPPAPPAPDAPPTLN